MAHSGSKSQKTYLSKSNIEAQTPNQLLV